MQERFSRLEKQGQGLNTSSYSNKSGGNASSSCGAAATSQGKKSIGASSGVRRINLASKCSLKSHVDAVRGLHFVPSVGALVSGSEECVLKVWDVGRFASLKVIEGVINFEPYLTLRGHKHPILSLAGRQTSNSTTPTSMENLVLSGSAKGVIKAWKIPSPEHIDPYGPHKDYSFCKCSWVGAHEMEPVWDIRIHQTENLFISVGADNNASLWQLPFIPQQDDAHVDLSHSLLSRLQKTNSSN